MNVIMVIVLVASVILLVFVGFFAWRKPILLNLALRNIPRRRSETVLIIVGLMLATLLITAAFGTGDTMTYSMRQAFIAGLGNIDLQIQRVNPVVAINAAPDFNHAVPTFDQKALDDLKAKVGNDDRIDGWSVDFEQTVPVIDTISKQASGQTDLHGVGSDSKQTTGELHTVAGSLFDIASLKDGEILLDKAAADKLNAKVGDSVQVIASGKPTDFKVRDIVVTNSPNVQSPTAIVSLPQAQTLFNAPGQITAINLSLKGGALDGIQYSDAVTDKLRGILDPKLVLRLRCQEERARYSQPDRQSFHYHLRGHVALLHSGGRAPDLPDLFDAGSRAQERDGHGPRRRYAAQPVDPDASYSRAWHMTSRRRRSGRSWV